MDGAMNLKPDLALSVATAQAIVDQAVSERTVATVSKLHGGEIAAVYEIAFVDPAQPPLVLKVYPDELHWKMQKEVTVVGLIQDRLDVSVPRILLADDSKRLLGLNFTVMTKLDGAILGQLETTLAPAQRLSAYAQIGRLALRISSHLDASVRLYRPNGDLDGTSDKPGLPDASIPTEA
jgi:hypothetical protein